MRKVRSRLTGGGGSILVLTGANLFILMCVCVLLTNHLVPRYGCRVNPSETHFVMGSYDRDASHVVTIAAGDSPRIYDGSLLIDGGIAGFGSRLEEWKRESGENPHLHIVLVPDRAVSSGTLQQITDMILSCGFTCSYAAVPALMQ